MAGLLRVQGAEVDQPKNIQMGNNGNNPVVMYPNGTTTPISFSDENTMPFGMAIAADGAAWVSYRETDVISKFRYSAGAILKIFTVPLPPPFM